MKIFSDTFKLYAYKNKDRCDLSIRVTHQLVMTFRLTHEELTSMFNNESIQFQSKNGQFWFVMRKRSIDGVRITVGNHGVDFNFRVNYTDWDDLKNEYHRQMNNTMSWDQ